MCITAKGHERSVTKSGHSGDLSSDKQESYVDVFLPFVLHRMRV